MPSVCGVFELVELIKRLALFCALFLLHRRLDDSALAVAFCARANGQSWLFVKTMLLQRAQKGWLSQKNDAARFQNLSTRFGKLRWLSSQEGLSANAYLRFV